jgi:hypothetical protein
MQVQKSEFILLLCKPSFFRVAHLKLRHVRRVYGDFPRLSTPRQRYLEIESLMTNNLESDDSQSQPEGGEKLSHWLRIGVVAAASALAGGMAAAWWYRKTLNKLQESGENAENPQFGISAGESQQDPFDEV